VRARTCSERDNKKALIMAVPPENDQRQVAEAVEEAKRLGV
jgi:hypothetical protein